MDGRTEAVFSSLPAEASYLVSVYATNGDVLRHADNGMAETLQVTMPALSISPTTAVVLEGDAISGSTPQIFTANLSPASNEPVRVAYATSDGTATAGADYTAANGIVTFAAGETGKTLTVQVIGDNAPEGDETFTVALSGAAGDATYISPTESTATVTITDDDAQTLSIADVRMGEGNSGTVNMEFMVRLNKVVREVRVAYATADGSATAGEDYTTTSGTLTFEVDRLGGTIGQVIRVPIIGDENVETNETFTVMLSSPSEATVVDGTATGTIVDDDSSRIRITPIDDFTELPSRIPRRVVVSATHMDDSAMRYRVESIGSVPRLVTVEPSELTDLVSGTSAVTISNVGRRLGRVRVRVLVSAGTDQVEEVFAATFSYAVAPLKPARLTARSGDGAVELMWAHAGGQTVTGYEYQQDGGSWTVIPDSNGDTVRHVVPGLTNGTAYTFRVRALNAQGMSPESDMASATPAALPTTLPAVANLRAFVDRNRVGLSWDRPAAGVGGDLSYEYRVGGGEVMEIPGSDATTTSYALTLLPGSHTIYVRAKSGTNMSPDSSVTATVVGPAAPLGLRAEVGDGEVTLRWTRTTDGRVGGYQYQVDGGRWSPASGVPGSGTELRIAGLTNGQEYTFGLRARGNPLALTDANNQQDQYGYGRSAQVRATPLERLPEPTGLEVKGGSLDVASLTVQWNAVTNARDYVATAVMSGSSIGGTVSGTEAAFAKLASGRAYTVSVYAVGDGTSYHSTGRAATLAVSTLPPVPRAPDGLRIERGDGEVTLRWTQATDSGITGYEYRSRTGTDFTDSWVVISGSDAATVSHTVSSLTNGTAYVFVLRAVNPTGAGASSLAVRAVPLVVPAAPANVAAEPEVAAVTLRWTRTADASVTGYEHTRDGGTTWVAFPSGSAHYRVTGLTNGQEYTFQLRALNARGAGAASAAVMATPDAAPGVPENLRAQEGDEQVTLVWEAPTSGGRVTRYQLWRTGAEVWTDIANSGATTTSHAVTGLTNGQSYQFLVRAASDVAVSLPARVLASPTAAALTLSIADVRMGEGGSGTTDMEFMVRLDRASREVVTVDYGTADGSAIAGQDYTTVSGTLTFEVHRLGSTIGQVIRVPIIGDATVESNETFTVRLSNPIGAVLAADGTATGTIIDDDASPIKVAAIEDFTELPSRIPRRVVVRAEHVDGDALQYRAEPIGRLPRLVTVGPSELTDLGSASRVVTISNPGRRLGRVRVRVIVSAGTDQVEEVFAATFSYAVAPLKPVRLTARSGDESVELMWAHAGGQTVTGYEYKQDTEAWTVIPNSHGDTVRHVVTGLTNGTSYTFRVRALNAQGMSPESEMASATPAALPRTLPGPANLQVRVDRNWVTLSWTRPSAGVDADIIYQYQVNGGARPYIPDSDATTTSLTLELLPGTHTIAIWAVNVKANFGGTIFTRRVTVEGPDAPSDLRAEVGDGEVTLRWRRSPDGRIGGYEYQVDGGSWSTAQGVPGTGTEFRITGLANRQEYTFRLRARGDWDGLVNSNYGYGPSAEVRATPNPLLPAPTGLAVKAGTQGATSFTVQWTAVSDATGYVATATLSGSTIISGTVSDTEAAFARLAGDTTYTVSVRATTSNQNYHATGRAATLTVRTLAPVPRTPEGLSIERGDGEVTLSWTQATGGGITGYEYRSRTGEDFTTPWVVIPGSNAATVSHTVSRLTNGTAYVFVLRAVNPSGGGASSPPVRAVPLTVPSAPEGVVAEPEVGAVTLRWTRTTDASVTGYEYARDGGTTWVAFPSGSVHYRVSGLTNGQEYAFELRALNVLGFGAASAAVTATPEAVPGMPRNLQADEGDGQVTLTWEAPTSGGRVMRYQLWRTGAESWTNIAGSDAMTTRHVVTGLSNGQSYQFLVRTANDVAVSLPAQVLATLEAEPTLSIADASASEGDSGTAPLVFTVTLTPASDEQVMVAYATADGIGTNAATTADSDYATTTGTLTFAAGDTSKTITVQITGDGTSESNETFTVTLSDPANAVISTTAGTATGTIIDNDRAITISPIADFTEFPTASRGVHRHGDP